MRATIGLLTALAVFPAITSSTYAEEKPDPRFGEWVTIFDGTGFDGWEVSKPTGVEFNWEIEEDGSITNIADPSKRKHNIATSRKFGNFEAHAEFKISEDGNSGLYLRGRAEIQILDSHGHEEPADNDMGALYRYKPPLVNAANPAGEWNTIDLRFIGTRIDAVLNGKLIQNNSYIPHKTGAGRTDEFDSPGMFELQGDHDKVWFRNLRVRPLFEGEGWRPIFDGKSLSGWKTYHGRDQQWAIDEGTLTNAGEEIDDLVTEEKFGDFLIHYEYKCEGNSGLFLRDLWEIQIHSNHHDAKATPHSDGALYDFYPPKVNVSKPKGEWSVIQAKVVGRKITVFQNGVLTHDEAECSARTYNKGDSSNLDAPGPIRLQGDHGGVTFANMWILPLD